MSNTDQLSPYAINKLNLRLFRRLYSNRTPVTLSVFLPERVDVPVVHHSQWNEYNVSQILPPGLVHFIEDPHHRNAIGQLFSTNSDHLLIVMLRFEDVIVLRLNVSI